MRSYRGIRSRRCGDGGKYLKVSTTKGRPASINLREKGSDLLVRAFAAVAPDFPGARLRLAGQGPLRRELEGLAGSLGVAADFLGFRDPVDLEPEYARAWALAVPSRWAEPLGLVAIEAVTRGLPAIVPSTGGLAEIVTPGTTGWHFTSADEAQLASCLRQALTHPHSIPNAAAAEVRSRYGLTAHTAGLRRVLRAVCKFG